MSKRNHIVERASDVNGGQYIQTNPSYNSGYEDGKKAGKEYCASEITTLREQVEKLTKERDELHRAFNQPVPRSEWEKMQEQLAALAEQNEKQRAFLEFAWKDIPMNEYAFKILEHVMNLPNLATPVLNRLKAEAYRELVSVFRNEGRDEVFVDRIEDEADALEKRGTSRSELGSANHTL